MLERELEMLGAGALGGLLKRTAKHAHVPGSPCANCQTVLEGPYCHICGQLSDDQHRSILHLAWEGIEGLTHLDGRLAQTLPPLFLNPGKLARDHFEGRRQRHVPPFRLFLIALLVFMFVLEGLFHHTEKKVETAHAKHDAAAVVQQKLDAKLKQKGVVLDSDVAQATTDAAEAGDKDAAKARDNAARKSGVHINVGPMPADGKLAGVQVNGKEIITAGSSKDVDEAFTALHKSRAQAAAHAGPNTAKAPASTIAPDTEDKMEGWLEPRLKKAIDNKEYYLMVLFTWAHRLAILLLPILAGLLALVYVRRRKFFVYDHLIVSMQFLSFVFLISALAWIIPDPVRGIAVLVASIWAPVNLYQTLRGAYGSKWWTAAIKTAFLWISTVSLFGVLMLGLMALALAEMA